MPTHYHQDRTFTGSDLPADQLASVEFEPGEYGSRAFALVGIELLGGAPQSLARYDRALGQLLALEEDPNSPVASVGGHR